MTEKISAIIEDSFCFRLLAAICTLLRSVWMNSIVYSIYAAICRGFKNAFENSAILGFLRANWDRRLNTRQGILPRFWHNLVHWSGMAVRRESNGLAAAMGESFFLRVFNQNFLIFCLAGIVAAIPVLPTMLLAVLVLGTFAVFHSAFSGKNPDAADEHGECASGLLWGLHPVCRGDKLCLPLRTFGNEPVPDFDGGILCGEGCH